MDSGCCVSRGIRRSSAASVRVRPCSRVSFNMRSEYNKGAAAEAVNGASVLGTRSQASRLLEKPSAAEAAVFLLAHTARLEAAPFQSKVRSKQDPVGLYLALLGRASSDRHTSQNRSQDIFHITGGTNVAGASLQRSHPHFFIRDAVRAHDGQSGKFIVQTSDIGQTRGLNVKNYHLRELLRDLGSQLIAGTCE